MNHAPISDALSFLQHRDLQHRDLPGIFKAQPWLRTTKGNTGGPRLQDTHSYQESMLSSFLGKFLAGAHVGKALSTGLTFQSLLDSLTINYSYNDTAGSVCTAALQGASEIPVALQFLRG